MTPEIAEEMRYWVAESVLDKEQRQMPRLSPEQNNIINTRTKSGYRRIRGPAGSGKTVCLAGRAATLHEQGKKTLILYLTISLGNEIRDLVSRFYSNGKHIEIRNYHDWAKKICNENGYGHKFSEVVQDTDQDATLSEKLPLLLDQIAAELITKDGNLPSRLTYDAIIVDEAQDLTPKWWGTIKNFISEGGEAVLAADMTQDLYNTAKHWTEEAMSNAGFSGRWTELSDVYRMPKKLQEFTNDFANYFLPEETEKLLLPPDQHKLDLEPIHFEWRNFPSGHNLIEEVVNAVIECPSIAEKSNSLKSLPYADVTFIVPTNEIGLKVSAKLGDKKFRVKDTFGKPGKSNWNENRRKKLYFFKGSGEVKGSTFHSYKGLENRAIVVLLPKPLGKNDLHAYYVALTRLKASGLGSLLIIISNWEEAIKFGEKWNIEFNPKENTKENNSPHDKKDDKTQFRENKNNPNKPEEGKFKYKENEVGLTYEKLFLPYFIGCKKIHLIDPYIKTLHQFRNMIDLFKVIDKSRNHKNEIKFHLQTLPTNDDDRMSDKDRENNFQELEEAAKTAGIIFTWEYRSGLHDREIMVDTGWEILLGRGLDIYQKFSQISLEAGDQSQRRTRAFTISYFFNKKLTSL